MKIGRYGAFLMVFLLVAAGVAAYVYVAYGPSAKPGGSMARDVEGRRPGIVPAPGTAAGAVEPPPAGEGAAAAPETDAREAAPARPVPVRRPPAELFFRYTGIDRNYGKLARVRVGSDAAPEFFDALNCEVVHVAGRRGLCLAADRGVITTYQGIVFDAGSREVVAEVPLAGVPSRTRVARDGRRAALTVFVSGHGYASMDFSTQTLLIDLATGSVDADLESFSVSRDGEAFQASDRNFWGVTFADDSRYFYATMSTGGEHHLIYGDAEERSARVIRTGVECPSLSPNGRRIAFKYRVPGSEPVRWQIAVLDLSSGQREVLAEKRSVDDQLEWLDDARVLYSMPRADGSPGASTAVWVAAVDGSRKPELFLDNAYSPAVLR